MNSIRNKIIIKAKELFFEKGFKNVTIEEIAALLFISKKTIYECFATKNDLVFNVV